jgi:hypothetical protein
MARLTVHGAGIGAQVGTCSSALFRTRCEQKALSVNYIITEIKVQDPDGHVLRFGLEPHWDRPLA